MQTARQLCTRAPDSQYVAACHVLRAIECGWWSDAASWLAHAATEEGDTEWGCEAGQLAAHFRGEDFQAIEALAADIERGTA